MIEVSVPAKLRCDHEGCETTTRAELFLTGAGGFVFRPIAKDWQVRMAAPTAALRTLCPVHAQLLDTPKVTLNG